ncbi:MAG: phenylalanine--tRNA ligase subunit beta [Candidatus Marinimicrobia bacterium]|nr:phenylalanine--tRNA ligase subunit beta [Candidatus Neomarinimicrobiota bacterium]
MIINRNWLEKYIDIPFSDTDLEEHLTYLGLETVMLKNPVAGLDKLIVGEIKQVEKHPEADKLTICQVFDGTEIKQIICGADNVAVGQKVPVALPGCELPGGFKIKRSKIRGVESLGMICAEDEIGLSDNHEGIMVLQENTQPGITMENYINSTIGASFEVDLTPNRPDCNSHIGIARDVSALTDGELRIPEILLKESEERTEDHISVDILDEIGCPRYAARLVKGVKVGPSPKWLADTISSVGLRPINNIVDLSNFVLMETGQPLHTFDYNKVAGKKIIVRKAKANEKVTTLDSEVRTLTEDILLICDAEKPVAIAGIMGLENSEISKETSDVLIEGAYFDPATIRKGSKTLALQTDASYRFERGADPVNVLFAIDRIASLIQQVAGGIICKNRIDRYVREIEFPEVTVRFKRINKIIGYDFDKKWVVNKFQRLGCEILEKTDEEVTVKTPSWRPDLEREIDYIEEVVRIFGMEKIPEPKSLSIILNDEPNKKHMFIEKMRTDLCGFGLNENYNNTLVSQDMAKFELYDRPAIELANPLSRELAFLRTSLIPGLLNTAKLNFNRGNFDLKLFEIGNIQVREEKSQTKARETMNFAVLMTGNTEIINWSYRQREANLYYLKGLLEQIAEDYRIGELSFEKIENEIFSKLVRVTAKGQDLCLLGELHPLYLNKKQGIDKNIWILEGNVDLLFELFDPEIRYNSLPKYPATQRDVSIVVDRSLQIGDIEKVIREKAGKNLADFIFYDEYKGENIEKSKRSLTFNLVFQNNERTLLDSEIDKVMIKIHTALHKELNAELR